MFDLTEFLTSLSKPAKYLGNEWNVTKKNPDKSEVKFALVFPDLYEIGMSSLGLRIIYSLINSIEWALVERVFAPPPDFEDFLKRKNLPLFSLENKIPLSSFDIVGFSLSYEMNYTNVLNILKLGKIPLKSGERDDKDPIVIAGGPCTFNPEPLSPFIDIFYIGDGEEGIVEILNAYKECKGERREKILERISEVEGVYVPKFWKRERRGRFLIPVSIKGVKEVKKRIIERIEESPLPSPIVPFSEIVFDRIIAEIARGCPQRCRFCQAFSIYSPYRVKNPDRVLREVIQLIEVSGYEDISLSSLSVSDYPYIEELLSALTENFFEDKISISIPSLRPSGLKGKILEEIKKIRKTGFTIAPEAGTERLRKVINKNISDEEIYRGAEILFSKGWRLIKLYFMIGLPTERDEDIDGIVEMAKKIYEIGKRIYRRNVEINITISPFVPKPHTPFQWCEMESLDSLKEKIKKIRKGVSNYPTINIKSHDPEMSEIEGILSRGDREVSDFIERVFERGGKLESWKDYFKYDLWREILTEEIMEKYLSSIEFDEPLPWDFINSGFPKETLLKEFQLALKGESTESCLDRRCSECRDCIFLKKILGKSERLEVQKKSEYIGEKQKDFIFYRAYFSKIGSARYLSNLEMMKTIERAFRRARIPVWITEGYHPHMHISFSPPLPTGVAGLEEICEFKSKYMIEEGEFLKALSKNLPEGISFFRLEKSDKASLSKKIKGFLYSIDLEELSANSKFHQDLNENVLMEVINSLEGIENSFLISEPRKIVFKVKFDPKKGGSSLRELSNRFSPEIFNFITREKVILEDE